MALSEAQSYQGLEFLARQVVEGFITGLHKSPFHGFSVEFAEHRLYNTGGSTRHLDWKLYARTEKLFVKKYEEETNLRCQLVIDNSGSMLFPGNNSDSNLPENKLSFSIHCAAAFIYLLRKQRDACGLTLFSDKIEQHFPARSSAAHIRGLFHTLESLLAHAPVHKPHQTQMAETLHEIAETVHKRSLIVIFSDMMQSGLNSESIISALQHIRHNKHEVILFNVYDQLLEYDFDFENRLYRFIDLENNEEIKLNPVQLKNEIIRKQNETKRFFKEKCAANRIDYVEADIRKGFHQVLMPFLLKRAKMS